jgi:hypothetical protein
MRKAGIAPPGKMTEATGLSVHRCRICGNDTGNVVHHCSEKMYGLGDEFDYFQCQNCACLQIEEIPPDLGKYYPDDYYSYRRNPAKAFVGLRGVVRRLEREVRGDVREVKKEGLAGLARLVNKLHRVV